MRLQEQNKGKIEIYGGVINMYLSTVLLAANYNLAK